MEGLLGKERGCQSERTGSQRKQTVVFQRGMQGQQVKVQGNSQPKADLLTLTVFCQGLAWLDHFSDGEEGLNLDAVYRGQPRAEKDVNVEQEAKNS